MVIHPEVYQTCIASSLTLEGPQVREKATKAISDFFARWHGQILMRISALGEILCKEQCRNAEAAIAVALSVLRDDESQARIVLELESYQITGLKLGYQTSDFQKLTKAPGADGCRTVSPFIPFFFRGTGSSLDFVDLYAGRSIFLICNGPSFSSQAQELLRRSAVMTCGLNGGGHFFTPNLWVSVDTPNRFDPSIWMNPVITKFVPMSHLEERIQKTSSGRQANLVVRDCPNVIAFRRNDRFNPDTWLHEDSVNWGGSPDQRGVHSVLLSALRICFLLGFRKIYLVGCDFEMETERPYWFGDGVVTADYARLNNETFAILSRYLEKLQGEFLRANLKVINTTPCSKLKCFPAMSLEAACEEYADDNNVDTRNRPDVSATPAGCATANCCC